MDKQQLRTVHAQETPQLQEPEDSAAPFHLQIWVEQRVYHEQYKCRLRLRNFNPVPDGKWQHNCGSAMQRTGNPHDSEGTSILIGGTDVLRTYYNSDFAVTGVGCKDERRLNNQIASYPHRGLSHRRLSNNNLTDEDCIRVSHMAQPSQFWLAPALGNVHQLHQCESVTKERFFILFRYTLHFSSQKVYGHVDRRYYIQRTMFHSS